MKNFTITLAHNAKTIASVNFDYLNEDTRVAHMKKVARKINKAGSYNLDFKFEVNELIAEQSFLIQYDSLRTLETTTNWIESNCHDLFLKFEMYRVANEVDVCDHEQCMIKRIQLINSVKEEHFHFGRTRVSRKEKAADEPICYDCIGTLHHCFDGVTFTKSRS